MRSRLNVGRNTITVMKSSIPYVGGVTNQAGAVAGRDVETLELAKLRVPSVLRGRSRRGECSISDTRRCARDAMSAPPPLPGSFTAQFSQQLAEVSQMRVKEAEAGEIIVSTQLYICPGSHHMRVSPTGRVSLDDGPRVSGYRPCADLTFESAAEYAGPMVIGVILTGMGNDGSRGVQTIRSVGGHVIAQDESTAVIFGMPQEAIKTGAVDQVLPMEAIYHGIEKRVLYIFGVAKVGSL